uniref:Odorant receptor n=1 Tax=Aulacocentrum confusum TaxID=2767324 RepID=A0A7G8Z935_9HYME|nr:olfactory receptor 16 [Aulacocentrum confusum]
MNDSQSTAIISSTSWQYHFVKMSKDNLLQYKSFRRSIKALLLFLGLWPMENPNFAYNILPYFQLLQLILLGLALLGFVKVHLTNVALVTRSAGIMVSYVTCALKMICMIYHRDHTRQIHKILDPHFKKLLNEPQMNNMVLGGIAAFRRLALAILLFSTFSAVACVFAPLIYVIYQHVHKVGNIKYILPYAAVYPWSISPNGLLYKLHYLFEFSATVTLVTITGCVDPLYTLYVFQMIAQLREMSYRLTHPVSEDTYKSVIRDCVKQYSILLECRDKLQMIYGPMILWMMATNAVMICAGLFQISQMKNIAVGQMMLFLMYVSAKMTQTFLCGWTGSKLTAESEAYRQAIFEAHWIGSRPRMTSILIMLGQKPLLLTACSFSVISVQMFVAVLNTSFSYFFLLQTLNN